MNVVVRKYFLISEANASKLRENLEEMFSSVYFMTIFNLSLKSPITKRLIRIDLWNISFLTLKYFKTRFMEINAQFK